MAVTGNEPRGNDASPALVRALGQWDLTAVGVNQVIGSGIYLLPASVAVLVSVSSSPLPYVAAGIANALIVLCFAEAGTRFREAGGPYVYARTAFGPFAGFQVAWMMWVTRLASQAALANALALYVGRFWGGATEGAGRITVVTVALGILAAINLAGVRYGSLAINLFTVAKLVPLLLFMVLGLFFIEPQRFSGLFEVSGGGFGEAVLLLMFAFGGYELITIPASEARSPRRDAPRALLTTIGVVCAIYLLVQIVAAGTLDSLETSETPLADAAAAFLGPAAGVLIAIGGLISIAGSNAGTMLAGPRITYALGEKGQLPGFFAHVNARFRTPDVSIMIYFAVSLGLAISGTFEQLAAVSAVARIVFYMATCAAVPVLRRRVEAPDGAFELPGGVAIPLLALVVCVAILAGADTTSLRGGGLALVVGAGLYLITIAARGARPAPRGSGS